LGARWIGALLLLLLSGPNAMPADPPDEEPQEIGLVEQARSRLAQIDITVIGSPEAVGSLTARELEIKLGQTWIRDFRIDRICPAAGQATDPHAEAPPETPAGAEPAAPTAPKASFLFYFDQPFLTMRGRMQSIEIARQLVERLVVGGNRVMLVSNAGSLEVLQTLTEDPEPLLEALERLENDRKQWDFFAHQEEGRVADVVRALEDHPDVYQAVSMARRYQMEELWRALKSFRRFKSALGQLVDLEAPRAAIYFADTLRSNPGEHYLTFFGERLLQSDPILGVSALDAYSGGAVFDQVVDEASAQGIRIYSVHAQGLEGLFEPDVPSSLAMSRTMTVPFSSRVRHADARETLQNLSAETGGYAFVNGVAPSKIANRILEESACLFLASFDPSGFPEDAALRVLVRTTRNDIKLRVRGRLVLQSETARIRSRLMRAFDAPGAIGESITIGASVIPTGYRDGRYSGLVQLRLPGTPIPNATWDLGASMVRDRKGREQSSWRISVAQSGIPVVFETEISFRPGDYEIVAVAHEASTDLVTSEQIETSWPNPNLEGITISPIALLQPVTGAFLRGEELRKSGSMARDAGEPVRAELPTALVGLICRGRTGKGSYNVERSLVGASETKLPPMVFDLHEDRCAQLRDVIPSKTMGYGVYRYQVRVTRGGRTLQERNREFMAVEPGS